MSPESCWITHAGTYYQTRKARLYTLPEKPIPIYVSSLVPSSATFAGFHGDGLLSVGGKDQSLYQQMIRRFEEGARSAGKDPAQMPRLIELNVAYGTELEGDLAAMKKYWGGALVPALYNQKIYTPKDSQENGKVVGPDTMRKMMCISERPEEHVQFARTYLDLGFDQLYFHSAAPDQAAFLAAYGHEVLPQLR